MRRSLVANHHSASARSLAFSFALHQHVHAAGQRCDFGLLPCDDIAQVFDGAGQMGDLFFELFHKGGSSTGFAYL